MAEAAKIFNVQTRGGYANQMIQYLVALSVATRVPACTISNVVLPDWNIRHPALKLSGPVYRQDRAQAADVETMIALLRSGSADAIDYLGYGQNMVNFLPVQQYRDAFRSALTGTVGWGSRHLVISVRGGEILDGRHPGYVMIPIEFYRQVIRETGLLPVFFGQLGDDLYSRALRRAFPSASFVASRSPMEDFETLRGSSHLIPSVSTFAWLACWLSHAQSIHMPLTGLFNPGQFPDHDFCPLDDDRFRYTWFPANYATPVAGFESSHDAMAGRWHRIDTPAIAEIKQSHWSRPRLLDQHITLFESDHYRYKYPDIEKAFKANALDPRLHYARHGFKERREGFFIDKPGYVRSYPDAADAVGRGRYLDLHHFHAAVGARQGYKTRFA